ncbi:MAG: hypothetical protein CML13_18735 [Puniceicoccaceae bacterium]|nr:hypothetical protein [Puniceicoccaceae bacterium]
MNLFNRKLNILEPIKTAKLEDLFHRKQAFELNRLAKVENGAAQLAMALMSALKSATSSSQLVATAKVYLMI